MIEIGYKLSSEEFGPSDLVQQAIRAEAAGFEFALASDHFHPWTDRQGESPFVWTVLGAIGQATSRLRVGTAVTCPTIRVHPAIIAQAAATTAALMPGRFFLGLGTGENLNEHVVGRGWPSPDVRLEMLEEAVEVIRLLWKGEPASHRGRHFTVEDARLYTLPPEPPEVMIAASKPRAAELAGRSGDAIITVEADSRLVQRFQASGGRGKPRYMEMGVCWAKDERRARKTAHEVWALAALEGALFTELPLPSHFEAAFKPITEEQVAENVICGPDPAPHLKAIQKAADAGYTHVCVHQIGPEQEGFLDFYEREVLPKMGGRSARRKASPGTRSGRGLAGKAQPRTPRRRTGTDDS
jgi:coenzyme F420-dependent glucose-6-phosphate dehydrogenase